MRTFAVLATGPSMSQEVADAAREFDGRVCVNDAYKLAPDADALCANDSIWWQAHPDALKFAGRKFSCNSVKGVEQIRTTLTPQVGRGSNSALFAAHVAIKIFGATRVLLFGVDNTSARGTHFFGDHPKQLKNTHANRYKVFAQQWQAYKHALPKDGSIQILNATPGSALQVFPFYEAECLSLTN